MAAAPSLEQALKGVSFPCDRARLVDYARNNNLEAPALAKLQDIPQRQYRDLAEVFGALSGKAEEEAEGGEALGQPGQVWWQQGWVPLGIAVNWLRVAADTWPHWYRLMQRLWFPWVK
jgi:cell wall assembly regulator SMI1